MSEQRNLGMTQRNEELQPIGYDVMSAEDYRGLSAAVDAGFKKFAKRIGLEPHEVGYMPARNPEGYRTASHDEFGKEWNHQTKG
jgi:hypothetical protein